ncbi:MAG: ABC transporter permease [Tannerellaceae bacterium]|nr:ABC transporter permease [Tannerellaceae bacterium]
MNVPFYIAKRYLFSKKSHNAINIISLISVCGVVIVTAALVCALSVMNGFNELIFKMLGTMDPELKIMPTTGKVFNPESADKIKHILNIQGIAATSEILQDNALIRYGDRQIVAVIKGVDDKYNNIASINDILIDGNFSLHDQIANYATTGIGVAAALSIYPGFTAPLEIMAPKRTQSINLANPAASMNIQYAYIAAVFQCNQQAYDENYIIVPISLARSLFGYEDQASAIELKLAAGANTQNIKKQLQTLLGTDCTVRDRYEQQDTAYKMMQSEKWIIFLILCFILAISLFNMVGSLSMLMIEKQNDVRTLRTLGADDQLIRRIFLLEGWMISGAGAAAGIITGLALCLLQQHLGIVRMGEAGTFVINSYPVLIRPTDLPLILAAVTISGFISTCYPVYRLGERWLKNTV